MVGTSAKMTRRIEFAKEVSAFFNQKVILSSFNFSICITGPDVCK